MVANPRPFNDFDTVLAIEHNARRDNTVWFVFSDRPKGGNYQEWIALSRLMFLELENLASSRLVVENVDDLLGELGQ